ncbi:MAG: cyclic nucleotide-binding domain-containing protein [Deltaproteobacteria bacterium]
MPNTPSLLVPAALVRRAITATRRALVPAGEGPLGPGRIFDADEIGAILLGDGGVPAELPGVPRRARLRAGEARLAPPAWRLHRRRFAHLLQDAAPFDALSPALRDELSQLARWRAVAPGSRLFAQGEPLDRAYVVAQGRIDLSAGGTLGIARPGSALGLVSALGAKAAQATAISPTGASLLEIPFALIAEAALCEPAFRERLLALGGVRQRARLLAGSAFAEVVGPEGRASIAALFEPRTLRRGEPLVQAGEVQNGMVLVEEGRLAVTARAGAGSERPIALAGPGELLGTVAALRGRPCAGGLRALEDSRVSLVDRAAFDLLIDWSPSLAGLPAILAARGELLLGSFFALRGEAIAPPAWLAPATPRLRAVG